MAKFEMSAKLKTQIAEAKELEDDIRKARGIINNAMTQYIKRKIGARNKAQVENLANHYAELEEYRSKDDIIDAYGWEFISEVEKDRLLDLWDAREAAKIVDGKYSDRVTEMLEAAMRSVGDSYMDQIQAAAQAKCQFEEEVKRIQKENAQRDWERKHGLRI